MYFATEEQPKKLMNKINCEYFFQNKICFAFSKHSINSILTRQIGDEIFTEYCPVSAKTQPGQ